MRKLYYITIFIIVLIVSFLGITYSLEYGNEDELTFELIGPSNLYLDVGTEYIEYGVKVIYNNIDVSNSIKIDNGNLDPYHLGEYKIKYEYNNEYIYRNVIVIDKISPTIELIGGNKISILLNGNYYEPGYYVKDNYNNDLSDKVIVTGTVDIHKEGIYEIIYSLTDDSGNKTTVTRKVTVKKPTIIEESDQSNKSTETNFIDTIYSNTIINNKFNSNSIYYEGYVKEISNNYQLKFKSRTSDLTYSYNMNPYKEHYYNGNINISSLKNGTYDIYIIAKNEERLMNKLPIISRIVRAKIDNKLVTIKYDNDYVSIIIEDFKYQYDVVIDPGHGNTDKGNENGIINESDLNLKVSKYEKCRYESMGYHVYMSRDDDSFGKMLGNPTLDNLERRALAIGYYGVVSRVVYSNHHNISNKININNFEIIVANQSTEKELTPEISIYNEYKNFNSNNDNINIYSKNYNNSETYNKLSGRTYPYDDYHTIIRIPYQLFNVKSTIYKPMYMSNPNAFNWYYSSSNWIKISELKIAEYVKFMGGTYNSNNKSCL